MGLFQFGRILGYAALGALAATSVQGLGWLTTQSASLRPAWTLLHMAAIALGLLLLIQARQPAWLDAAARNLWVRVRAFNVRWGSAAPLVIGGLWAFMPCGLLYSALMVAALSGGPSDGAITMTTFAIASSLSLMAAPWLLLRLRGMGAGDWGMRLAGLALAVASGFALWMDLVHDTAPWCAVPGA